MSVFTEMAASDCIALLHSYPIGEYRGHEGLPGGVENSNFSLLTTQGRFVITLFERQSSEAAQYTLGFMQRCRSRGLPVPAVITTNDQAFLARVHDKPVAICTQLDGIHVENPDKAQCRQVGRLLALLHRVGPGSMGQRPNPFGTDWRNHQVTQLIKYLDSSQREALQQALQIIGGCNSRELPSGTIHADIFRDNVLFEDKALSGVVDFHYACHDRFMLDIATCINDWCNTRSGRVSKTRRDAMLEGYASIRQPSQSEIDAIPVLLVESALRYWLSRLHDKFFPRTGSDVESKSPDEIENRLRDRMKALA